MRGSWNFDPNCADVLGSVTRAARSPSLRRHVNIPLRRGLRPGARRARLTWALKPHNKMNSRMLVRDANTGEMMEMCLKTGHLLKLGSPPSEDMRFPASALRHAKPVPAQLRPKEVAPIVVTAPSPPADATPPPLPARVAAPTPPPPPPSTSASPASLPKSSVASTPAQSPRASARKRRGSLLDGVNKLLGKETNPVHDLDAALGRLAKADLSAADKIALALKLRSYADWLDAATPRAASPAALVSTPAQDGFRYRFETSPGDAQKALNTAPRFPLTTPEFERQASTSPLPSPEVTSKVLDTVVEMSNDELVAAVRAEAVRRLDRSRAHRLEYLLLDGDHVGRRSAGVVRPVGEHCVHLVGVLGGAGGDRGRDRQGLRHAVRDACAVGRPQRAAQKDRVAHRTTHVAFRG